MVTLGAVWSLGGRALSGPHPGPLPEGEGEKRMSAVHGPHPGPLPEGEGEKRVSAVQGPHPGPLPQGEGDAATGEFGSGVLARSVPSPASGRGLG